MDVFFIGKLARRQVALAAMGLCSLIAPAAPALAACDVIVYRDADFLGEHEEIKDEQASLAPRLDRQISSLRVIEGQWTFFAGPSFRGEILRYGPGHYARLPSDWNDQIGSMRCGATADSSGATPPDLGRQASPDNDLAQATREVGYFYGHLMLPKQLDRAKEIRQRFPSLATRIDVLVAGQAEIRQEGEREKREFRVEDETWQRDENEKRARQRRDPKAPSPTDRLQTETGLVPDVCKTVEAGHTALYRSPWTEKIAQATALREAGNVPAACKIYGEIRQQNETVSKAYDACNKKIKGIYTMFAREGMFNFFVLTQKIRMQVLEGAHCP